MSRRTIGWVCLVLGVLVVACPERLAAEVGLNPMFTDNMVLQQGRRVPVWGEADNGETVSVSVAGKQASATAVGGQWMAWLEPLDAGGPHEMIVKGSNTITLKNVLIGEVWICSGQSNMAWPVSRSATAQEAIANSANSQIRLFTVERTATTQPIDKVVTKKGWVACGPQTVPGFSAVGYFFGRDLQAALKVPVGLINTSWGGTPAQAWTDKQTLASDPSLRTYITRWERYVKDYPRLAKAYQGKIAKWKEAVKKARDAGKKPPRRPRGPQAPNGPKGPSHLYNGMIHPILPYAIRGAIWYQGEANAGEGWLYRKLFPAMISNWRKVWKQQDHFPFLFVQLAPYDRPGLPPWAEIRESQWLTTKTLPKVGQAVITDLGEEHDIHPKKKAPVGARLALAARAIAYGEDIVYSGPEYAGKTIEGNKVILRFKHVGSGLVAKGGELKGFTVAGQDREFVPAKARILDGTVMVSSPMVPKPVAVRYAWSNYPQANLVNKEGLPATPFRTDDFPLKTQPK